MTKGARKFAFKPLVTSIAAAIIATQSMGASAASFDIGDFEITFDSTFSAGASWRIEDRDFQNLVGKTNNQTFDWTGNNAYDPIHSSASVWSSYGSYSSNNDMGNLNYDPGESFSQVVKGLHELAVTGESYGALVRFMYFKDFAVEGIGYKDPVSGQAFDPCRDDEAKELVCQDFRFLDAYVYADFDFNDGNNPVSVRVGEQVLSWGESTLIPHGINVSAVDIGRLKAPGADLKEAFIPTGMVWANIGLTDELSLEAFYQYEWQRTHLPVPGTYFSTNDFAGAGGQHNNIQLGFAANADMGRDELTKQLNAIGAMVAGGADPVQMSGAYIQYAAKYAIRADDLDIDARDDGQFGVKLGWYAPELNHTEFGFYFINYHSRRPLISGVASDFRTNAIQQDLGALAAGVNAEQLSSLNAFTKGIIVYPEDIKLYGFSFNTTIGGTAVSGEISYRQDDPIQVDDAELLFAAMPEQLANAGLRPEIGGISQIGDNQIDGCNVPMGGLQLGETGQGYCLMNNVQAQFTLIHAFGPTLGLDNFAAVAEAGYISIMDMPSADLIRFNAPGTARSGATYDDIPAGVLDGVQNGEAPEQVFPTDSAWGYRVVLAGELNGVFGSFNLKPKFIYSHDVEGVTPDPLFLFHEDKKSVGLSLDIDYQSKISFGFSYNAFYDGVGTSNQLADRDYVSFNVKYSL